jgi:hypothetical protein
VAPKAGPFSPTPALRAADAHAIMDGRMRLDLHGMEISTGDWQQPCETEIVSAGGYVVTITTVVPDQHLTLASSYLSTLAGETAASHMHLSAGDVRFDQRVLVLPGMTHARGCLLDHAAELRELVAVLLGRDDIRVELLDQALSRAEKVWETGSRG